MTDLNPIDLACESLFNEEGERILIWNDPEMEFQSTLAFVTVDGGKPPGSIRSERSKPRSAWSGKNPTI